MLPSHNEYRKLGNRPSGGAPRRFLIGIGACLLLFGGYLYYSLYIDDATAHDEIAIKGRELSKCSDELLDIKINVDKVKALEANCQRARNTAQGRADQCTLNLNDQNDKIVKLEEKIANQTAEINNQTTVIASISETLELLKTELAQKDNIIHGLKTASEVSKVEAQAASEVLKVEAQAASGNNAAPVNLVTPVPTTTNSSILAESRSSTRTANNGDSAAAAPEEEEEDDENADDDVIPEPKNADAEKQNQVENNADAVAPAGDNFQGQDTLEDAADLPKN